jgi:hypothetical protein
MKTVESYKKKVVKEADAFLKNGLDVVGEIEKTSKELFPYGPGELSKASEAFESELAASRYVVEDDLRYFHFLRNL